MTENIHLTCAPASNNEGAVALRARAPLASSKTAVEHGCTAYKLCAQHAARAIGNTMSTAQMLPRMLDPQTVGELFQFQMAVAKRLQKQQQNWFKGCAVLWDEYGQIRKANTVSKFAEQQFNFVVQCSRLVSDQLTELVELQENVEVDYSFWVSDKLGLTGGIDKV